MYLHMLFSPAEMIQGPVMKIATNTKRLPYEETVKILKLFSLEIKQITWSMMKVYQLYAYYRGGNLGTPNYLFCVTDN